MILLAEEDFALLSDGARREVLSAIHAHGRSRLISDAPLALPEVATGYDDFDMRSVEDITAKQVARLFDTAPNEVRLGLLLLAERGPIIRSADLLAAGVDLKRFQSATTRRVRRQAGPDTFMLGWDNWKAAETGDGRFAITPITHQALRKYFGLL